MLNEHRIPYYTTPFDMNYPWTYRPQIELHVRRYFGYPSVQDLKRMKCSGNNDAEAAASWWAANIMAWLGPRSKIPHVIKAWSWLTDTPKSDKGDVDIRVEIGGRSEKCKTKMTPISANVYQLSIIRWVNGRTNPVWATWASGKKEGKRYTL